MGLNWCIFGLLFCISVSGAEVPNPCPAQTANVLCVSNSFGPDWIVIQQRYDLSSTDFDRKWKDYREGFGTIGKSSDFWWGLERIHQLTKTKKYELLVELTDDNDESRYVRYSSFEIGSEAENYKLLELDGFSGTDADANGFVSSKTPVNQMFSTSDRDNDKYGYDNCAGGGGGGWWWNDCGYSLNRMDGYTSWSWWSHGDMKSTRMSIRERK